MSTLLLPHLDSAFNLARWLVGSQTPAEDIVHAAFMQVDRSASIGRTSDPRLLLLRLVREKSYEWLNTPGGDLPPEGPSLAAVADAQSAGSALRALPVRLREVLVLRELERLEYGEIAQVAGLPVLAVFSMVSTARQRFHALSQRSGPYEPCRTRTNVASSASSRSDTAQNDMSPCVQ